MTDNERRRRTEAHRAQSRQTKECENDGDKRTEETTNETFETTDLLEERFVRENWEIIFVAVLLWASEEIWNVAVRYRRTIGIIMKASACAGSFWLIWFAFRS
ncbi:MAG: hypothetical protein ACTS80_01090 [Candidatus Hodgkinia cicadicola]